MEPSEMLLVPPALLLLQPVKMFPKGGKKSINALLLVSPQDELPASGGSTAVLLQDQHNVGRLLTGRSL